MDLSLHSKVKSDFSWVDSNRWKPSKATKDANIGRQGLGLCNLGCTSYIDYLDKRRTISSEYYIALLVRLKEEMAKKRSQVKKKKVVFHQDNASCYKSMATIAKLHELHFELLPHPPYSPDLVPSDYWLFGYLKGILKGKRFGSNEEVMSETEAYFEAKINQSTKKASNC